jgi:phosphoribosylpyrophosphate synthetase
MTRNTFYDLCHELKDGTITKPWKTVTTKRNALQIARAVAKTHVADAWNVVVMDTHDNTVVGVFPVPPQSAGA